jgi:cell division septation protein DedD
VDSQESDSVVHVDGEKTWIDAVFATVRPSDHHVSDDEIFEILNAGSDGETAADLCAAKGVTVPMYCVWKSKYRDLNLEELRKARRWEHWRTRGLVGVLVAAVVLGAGGIVFALARTVQANLTIAAAPALPPAVRMAPVIVDAPLPVTTPAPTPEPAGPSAVAPAVDEPGYKIQVAAANTLQEGRALVDRLTSAGYPAYLSRATVSDVEVFRVRIGPFDTLPAAEGIASQLRRDGYDGAWIAR